MKAERRHELHQNKLAEWLAQVFKVLQPHLRKITIAAVAVAVVFGLLYLWNGYLARSEAAAWDAFFETLSSGRVSDLEKIAEQSPDSRVGHWALVFAADARLAEGCELLFKNKAEAYGQLQRAEQAYTTIITQSREPKLLERAYFGRARAREGLAATPHGWGKLDEAIGDYQHLVQTWPEGPYAALARRHLGGLDSPQGRRFYDRFVAEFDPKPPVTPEPETPEPSAKPESHQAPAAQSAEQGAKPQGPAKVQGQAGPAPPGPQSAMAEPGGGQAAKPPADKLESPKPTSATEPQKQPQQSEPHNPGSGNPQPQQPDAPRSQPAGS